MDTLSKSATEPKVEAARENETARELDDDALHRWRGDLLLQLEDAGPAARKAVESELDQVEAEITARRRANERVKAVQIARERRERDEQLAARAAERQSAGEKMTSLGSDRQRAGHAIDEALSVLETTIMSWALICLEMADASRVLDIDHFLLTNCSPLVAKINSSLAAMLPRSNFQRWEHDDRDKSFAEIDAPLCAWMNFVPSPEEGT